MDLDARMKGLETFRKRIEALLAGGPGETTAAEVLDGKIGDQGKRLDELEETVTGMQQRLETAEGAITGEKLDLAGLADMVTWFGQNREGLEALLSIGDDLADRQPVPGQDGGGSASATILTGTAPAGTALGGATEPGNAISGQPGTDAPVTGQAAPAAPGA